MTAWWRKMESTDRDNAARRLPGIKKVISIAIIWLLILGAGLVVCELYVRSTQDLQVFSFPLQKNSPYYSAYDDYKIYNRKFFEERPSFFTGWPVKPEFFESDTSAPRYVYRPNLTLAAKGGKLVPAGNGDRVYWSSNSYGFRGGDFPVNKSPGTIRIVCLGASTTEGIGYDNETYPFYLQQELNQVYPGKKIEVINAGHHAYKARDNLALLEQYILPLNPDLIIFYEAANDLNFTEFSGDLQGSACWREGTCWLSGKPWGFKELYLNSALFVMLSDRFGDNAVPPPMTHSFSDTGTKPGAVQYADTLHRIAVAAKSANTTLVFTSFVTVAHEDLRVYARENPSLFNQVYRTYYPLTPGEMGRAYAYYNNQSRQVAAGMNLTWYDLAGEFPKDPRYFPFDYIHLSPEGNRLFARLLVQHLRNGTVFF
jgi:lysophospholipase L1-like esterase